MLDTVSVKIAPGDEGNFRLFRSRGRGWIRAAIKNRQLSNRLSVNVHGEYLFPSIYRCLEDTDLAPRDDVESTAGFTF